MDHVNATERTDRGGTGAIDTGKRGMATQPGRQTGEAPLSQNWRVASGVLGGMLVANGLRRRSLGGMVLAAAGGVLLRQGVTGQNVLRQVPMEPLQVQRTVTIRKSPEELYRLWRDPKSMQQIMGEFIEITMLDENRARWVVHGPLDARMQWEMLTVEDRPGALLRWKSLAATDMPSEGSIAFRKARGDRGTEVTLRLQIMAPGGLVGTRAARLLKAFPGGIELKLLRNLQALAETGEVPTTRRQPACRNDGRGA